MCMMTMLLLLVSKIDKVLSTPLDHGWLLDLLEIKITIFLWFYYVGTLLVIVVIDMDVSKNFCAFGCHAAWWRNSEMLVWTMMDGIKVFNFFSSF